MSREVWIGDLPSHWTIARLGALGSLCKGSGGSKEDNRDFGVPVVRYGEIYTKFDRVIRDPRSFISLEDTHRYTPLPTGSLVFAGSGEDPEEIGKSALSLLSSPAFVGGDSVVFTPRKNVVDPNYLTYVLDSKPLRAQKAIRSTGFTVVHISAGKLKTLPIPLPPLDEQRVIADYLDKETAQIDALVAKQVQFIGLLRERRLSQITDAFSRLGEPDSELRRIAHIQTGVTLSGDGDPLHPTWPYLRVANVQMGRVDLEEVKDVRLSPADAAASMLRAGDVLMTEGGDIDKLGRGTVWDGTIDPIVHQNHVFAVRANRDRLVPEYLAWWLDSVTSRRYFYLTAKKTTNLASTNKTVVGRLPINVPPLYEQRAVVQHIDEQTSRIDTLITKAEEHIALAKERRAALITAAVTGQFDVRTARKAG